MKVLLSRHTFWVHGWHHMKVLLSGHTFCVHHGPIYSVTLFKATYLECTGVELHPATYAFGKMTRTFYVLLQ